MLTPFDYFLLAASLVQWDMARHYLRARRDDPKAHLKLAAAALVLAAGFLLGLSPVLELLNLPARAIGWFVGAVHVWLVGFTAGWPLYRVWRGLFARADFDPARRKLLDAAGGALLAAPFAAIGYGAFIERTRFGVREIDIPLPDLPRDLDGIRLLQLSDIHLGPFLSERELARVVDAANETRCHVALVTGDLISSPGDPLDECLRQLARLRTDAGTLGCMGNHEIYARAQDRAEREGARLGIRFLRSRSEVLRFGNAEINLAGVDYQRMSRKERYLEGAERMLRPGALNLLLSHNPDVFPAAAKKGYNLSLSGHTHGGQVTVEILDQMLSPVRMLTPYVHGLYRQGGCAVYVTRGIGTIGIPARIGAPPEISVLRMRKT